MLLNKAFWRGLRKEERRRLSSSPNCLLFEAFGVLFQYACACRKNLFIFGRTGCSEVQSEGIQGPGEG